jgi:hypothetical protein
MKGQGRFETDGREGISGFTVRAFLLQISATLLLAQLLFSFSDFWPLGRV